MISAINNNQVQPRQVQNFGAAHRLPEFRKNFAPFKEKHPIKAKHIERVVKRVIKKQKDNVLFDLAIGFNPKGFLEFNMTAKTKELGIYAEDLVKSFKRRWFDTTGIRQLKGVSRAIKQDSDNHVERQKMAEKMYQLVKPFSS